MLEVNDGKAAVVHEIGLVTNISKLHNPIDGKTIYNITLIHASGTCMFTTSKDLFEQWILGVNQCINELDGKTAKILIPEPQVRFGGKN